MRSVKFWLCRGVKCMILCIGNKTYDRLPGQQAADKRRPTVDSLSQRVFSRKELSNERLIYNHNLRRAVVVEFGKLAPPDQRNLHGPEVVDRHVLRPRCGKLVQGVRRRLALDPECRFASLADQREIRRTGYTDNTG